MSDKLHKNEEVISEAKRVLRELSDGSRSIKFATILTDDGFEVANTETDGSAHNRIAAMSSSMQALGDAVARDLKMGDSEYLIIAAPKGYMIQLRVPGQALVLAAYFDGGETLGLALSLAKRAAAAMGAFRLPEAA